MRDASRIEVAQGIGLIGNKSHRHATFAGTSSTPLRGTHNQRGEKMKTNFASTRHFQVRPLAQPKWPHSASVVAAVNASNKPGPQNETDIAIDPTNPNHLIGGSNDFQPPYTMRVYESFDGGKTWTSSRMP